jgi:hypothetical protein
MVFSNVVAAKFSEGVRIYPTNTPIDDMTLIVVTCDLILAMLVLFFCPRSAASGAGPATSAVYSPSEDFGKLQPLFPTPTWGLDLADPVRPIEGFHFTDRFDHVRPLGPVSDNRPSHSSVPTAVLVTPQILIRRTNPDGKDAAIVDEFAEHFRAVFNASDRFPESDESHKLDETDVSFFGSNDHFDFSESFEATAGFAETGEFDTTESFTFSMYFGRSKLFVFTEGKRESSAWQRSDSFTVSQSDPTVGPLPTKVPNFWASGAGIAVAVIVTVLGLCILGIAAAVIVKCVLARRRKHTDPSFDEEMRHILDQGLLLDLVDITSPAGD